MSKEAQAMLWRVYGHVADLDRKAVDPEINATLRTIRKLIFKGAGR